MIYFWMAQIFLEAGLLCSILYLVAKHEADYSFSKVAMVAAGISVGSFFLYGVTEHHLPIKWKWLMYPIDAAFAAFMIVIFCWVSVRKSILVVVIFCGFHLAARAGLEVMKQRIGKAAEPMMTMSHQHSKTLLEIQKEIERQGELAAKSWSKPRSYAQSPLPANAPAWMRDNYHAPAAGPAENGQPDSVAPDASPASTFAEPETMAMPVGLAAGPTPQSAARQTPGSGADTGSKWDEAGRKINFTGLTADPNGGYMAVVDGRQVGKGDIISAEHDGLRYSWKILDVNTSGLQLQPVAARP